MSASDTTGLRAFMPALETTPLCGLLCIQNHDMPLESGAASLADRLHSIPRGFSLVARISKKWDGPSYRRERSTAWTPLQNRGARGSVSALRP